MSEETTDASAPVADPAPAAAPETEAAPAAEAAPQAEAPATTASPTDAHPALKAVDALEKYLENELPMAAFLAVQAACAYIRTHLQ